MSKMDSLRAMREARYLENQARAGSKAGAPRPRVAPKPTASTAAKAEPLGPEPDRDAAGEQLCGHRNMSGRTCTREHGHAAKSHRYS